MLGIQLLEKVKRVLCLKKFFCKATQARGKTSFEKLFHQSGHVFFYIVIWTQLN